MLARRPILALLIAAALHIVGVVGAGQVLCFEPDGCVSLEAPDAPCESGAPCEEADSHREHCRTCVDVALPSIDAATRSRPLERADIAPLAASAPFLAALETPARIERRAPSTHAPRAPSPPHLGTVVLRL